VSRRLVAGVYRDGELANQIRGTRNSTFIRGGDTLLAERQTGTDTTTLLLGIDDNNSVMREAADSADNASAYNAYGYRSGPQPAMGKLGFNGELAEAGTGWQLLGNGYRAYNPLLMRFHSPDSKSPFGEGGVNGYAYCEGDPVNFTDPTGHSIGGAILRGFRAVGLFKRPQVARISRSAVSEIPEGLRRVPEGRSVTKLRTATIEDVHNLDKISGHQNNIVKNLTETNESLVGRGVSRGYSRAQMEASDAYIATTLEIAKHSVSLKEAESGLKYFNEGGRLITKESRSYLVDTVQKIRNQQFMAESQYAKFAGQVGAAMRSNSGSRSGWDNVIPSGAPKDRFL
jgi:RHS repeat-associated protein